MVALIYVCLGILSRCNYLGVMIIVRALTSSPQLLKYSSLFFNKKIFIYWEWKDYYTIVYTMAVLWNIPEILFHFEHDVFPSQTPYWEAWGLKWSKKQQATYYGNVLVIVPTSDIFSFLTGASSWNLLRIYKRIWAGFKDNLSSKPQVAKAVVTKSYIDNVWEIVKFL